MGKRLIFFIIMFLSFEVLSQSVVLTSKYLDLPTKAQRDLHLSLLRVIAKRSLATKYDISKIRKDSISYSELIDFLNLVSSPAYAQSVNKSPYCHFGGWTSKMEDGVCLSPWKGAISKNSEFSKFGPTYTGEYSCGSALLFRCNPTLYGPSDVGDPLGQCVETDDSKTSEASQDCLDHFLSDPTKSEQHLANLKSDPKKLAQYLGIVVETLAYCKQSEDPGFCNELREHLEESTDSLMSCYQQEALYDFLPNIVTPVNEEELNRIANNLGLNFSNYYEEIRKREVEIRERNLLLYQQGFTQFSSDSRTQAINQRMRDNSTKCLLDTCVRSKPAGTSKEKCARYVKFGLFPVRGGPSYGDQSGPWNERYPWSTDAVESGPWLENMGYENAMDIPELAYLTPENAPVGAVIVYEDTTPSRNYIVGDKIIGGPGHIEIKTAESEYISDFITSTPTRIGGARVPIGIYIQIPEEIKEQIIAIPGN